MDEELPPEEDKDNVVFFPGITIDDIPSERVLKAALEKTLKHVIIVGRKEDGEWYHASTSAHIPSILWMLECAKSDLLKS